MIIQQNCVYVLIEHGNLYRDGIWHWGVYPNFKKAYQRLEELAQGKLIVDCGDRNYSAMFEAIDIQRDARHPEYYGHCSVHRYSIIRNRLTIRDDDQLISVDMIDKIMQENKGNSRNSKYRLKEEVI